MKKKRVLILGLCLLVNMSLTGCGASSDSKKSNSNNTNEVEKNEVKEVEPIYFKKQSDFSKNDFKNILSKTLSLTSLSRQNFDGIDTVDHEGFVTKYKIVGLYLAKDFDVADGKIKRKVENEILMIIEANVKVSKSSIYFNENDSKENEFTYYMSVYGQNISKKGEEIIISAEQIATGSSGNAVCESSSIYEILHDTSGKWNKLLVQIASKESQYEEATKYRWFREDPIDENEYVLEKIEIK